MASNANTSMSPQQKEKLLCTLEFHKYQEFAKIKNCTKTKGECESFWNRVAPVLNALPGAIKQGSLWRRCWRDAANYTVKMSKSKARVKDGEGSSFVYTMDDSIQDRIMALVGWDLADINNQDDDDKENEHDPLPGPKRKRSLSPLSTFLAPCSPVEPRSPLSSSASSPSTYKCNCNCREAMATIMKAIECNTQSIAKLTTQLQTSLGGLMVLNVEEDNIQAPEAAAASDEASTVDGMDLFDVTDGDGDYGLNGSDPDYLPELL